MAETRPGLVLDLHEYDGHGFWMSARHQRSEDDEAWEQRIAAAVQYGAMEIDLWALWDSTASNWTQVETAWRP